LRDMMSEDRPFDVDSYQRLISLNCDAAQTLASASRGRQ
jgi:hypothetical protein